MDIEKESEIETENKSDQINNLKITQRVCVLTVLSHVMAVFASIYSFRLGDLNEFSTIRLMNFAATHPIAWRFNCLAVSLSCLSFLALTICIFRWQRKDFPYLAIYCLAFTVIGVSVDLSTQFNMMIYFHDLSYKLVFTGTSDRTLLVFAGWSAINQATIQFMILAGALYGLAGSGFSYMFIQDKTTNSWIGWIGILLWGSMLASCLLTFLGELPWAIIILLSSTIFYVIWVISIYVNIDYKLHHNQI